MKNETYKCVPRNRYINLSAQELVLKGLERAVNNTDGNAIIKCYPEFMKKSLPVLSYD